MVTIEEAATISIEAFYSDWFHKDDSLYPCVLVVASNNTQRMCLGGNDENDDDDDDELCVTGGAALVCRPPPTTTTITMENVTTGSPYTMEIGCPQSNYLLAYNGAIAEHGILTTGYQM